MNLLKLRRGLCARFLLGLVGPRALVVSAAAAGLLISANAEAQLSAGTLTGTITDAATHKPLKDVVVTVTSPSLQGEQTVVTDASGSYRIPNLPPGDYTLHLDADTYKPYGRGGIGMHADSTIRVNAEMLPESVKAEEIVVVGKAPIVDVGSAQQGVKVDQEFISRIPTSVGAANRSFEDLAIVSPGTQSDLYGTSFNGTTSPENSYLIDGLSVNDTAVGVNSSGLNQDFVKEVSIINGGYMPEYGRATGGILDVVTQSGSNEFHGYVDFYITPGGLEGHRSQVQLNASAISTNPKLSSLREYGAGVGGPIIKDKLWFFAGVDINYTTYKMDRQLNKLAIDSMGNPINDPNTGLQEFSPIAGGDSTYTAQTQQVQYFGKLSYLINQDNNISLSISGQPSWGGGNGTYAAPLIALTGQYGALATEQKSFNNDIILKYSSAFDNKRWLLDLTAGWHHQYIGNLPADGSALGSSDGLAGIPTFIYQNPAHSVSEFEGVPDASVNCKTVTYMGQSFSPCSIGQQYFAGGTGYIDEQFQDRWQGKAVLTHLITAAGHHVIKGGVDIAVMGYNHNIAYTGGDYYLEDPGGAFFTDYRNNGALTSPDQFNVFSQYDAKSHSTEAGGFLQDSWSIMDKVTLNFGARYDAQFIFGDDGKVGLSLPNEWSPRVGLIYDLTQQGKSKIYVNYARFFESVPLDLADRELPGVASATGYHLTGSCDPIKNPHSCDSNSTRIPVTPTFDPNQKWIAGGGDGEPVDPNIKPQSTDEFNAGFEYQIFEDGVLGISYTKRWMNDIIEDMSRDEAQTYFIGNPGFGIASDFPKAVRNYDGGTIYLTKAFSHQWLAQASYTLSSLRGNWSGLFRPETTQLDPNINSDFDLRSLLPNRTGPLPGDATHNIKLFAAKDFILPNDFELQVGASYFGVSGAPLNVLGAHPLYGSGEVYILPRGDGGRLPWVHTINPNISVGKRLSKDSHLLLSLAISNVFDFQQVTGRDQNFTYSSVLPVVNGTQSDIAGCGQKTGTCNLVQSGSNPATGVNTTGKNFNDKTSPGVLNPNYGNATSYQAPREFRFGAKITF